MAKRILMVDDERDLVFATKLYLEVEGYEVLAAYDGHQALDLLEDPANRPDLIVLDVFMPRLTGWEVLRMIRANEEIRDIPVIMLTAAGQDADKARGWHEGVDFYQTKPFDPKDLLMLIERLLMAAEQERDEESIISGDE